MHPIFSAALAPFLRAPGPRRVCAWCLRDGRPSDMGPAPDGCAADTHGICEPCRDRQAHLLAPTGDQADALRAAVRAANSGK